MKATTDGFHCCRSYGEKGRIIPTAHVEFIQAGWDKTINQPKMAIYVAQFGRRWIVKAEYHLHVFGVYGPFISHPKFASRRDAFLHGLEALQQDLATPPNAKARTEAAQLWPQILNALLKSIGPIQLNLFPMGIE